MNGTGRSEQIASPHIDGPFSSVHVISDAVPLLDCEWLVAEAKSHAAQHGWQTKRHTFHATQDLPIDSIQGISEWFGRWADTVALPELAHQFQVSELTVSDAFIIRYSLDCQPGLELHSDGSELSFIIALNGLNEYEGGGTFVRSLDRTFRLQCGAGFFFSGKWKHAGVPIRSGERFVLAAFIQVGDAGAVVHQVEAAEAEITLAADKTDVAAWQELSNARFNQGRPEEALAAHEAAVAANPSSAIGWYHYGNHLGDECKELRKALEAYRTAACLDASDGNLWLQVAYCQIRMADSTEGYEQALESFERAAGSGNVPLVELSQATADVLCVLDRHAEALPYYATVLRIQPEDAEAWAAQGDAYAELMDITAAVHSFQKACHYKPTTDLWRRIAMLLHGQGEHQQARRSFEEACKLEELSSDGTSNDSDSPDESIEYVQPTGR